MNIEKSTENSTELPQKIKVQKRTITEKQKEALQKARDSKLKKKVLKDHKDQTSNSSDFLYPSPYLMGTVLIGLGGLVAYSYLKPATNSEIIVKKSTTPLNMVSLAQIQPKENVVSQQVPEVQKPQEERFFKSAMRL